MKKLIVIENKVYRISEKDWVTFKKMIDESRYDNEKFYNALEYIENKYKHILTLDGVYNY